MESMVDFGEFQPFEDVEMIRPSITVLSKDKPGGEMRLFKWLTAGRPPEALSEEIAVAPTVSAVRLEGCLGAGAGQRDQSQGEAGIERNRF